MGVAGVGTNDQQHIGLFDRLEGLCAGRGAEGLSQAIACRGVADPRAGVDVVGVEGRTHKLLHQVGLFVGAARRRDAADRVFAVLGLDAFDFGRSVLDGLVPAHLFPWVGDLGADHGLRDAVLVSGVAPSKTALHTGMAFVGFAVFPRHHAHHGVALHLGFEAATHAAVGAGGDQAVLGLAEFDDGLFLQGRGGASLDTSATRHALAVHEGLVLAGRHAALKTPARNGQRKRALGFFTGAHTAVAHDALAGVVGEVGVALVFG